MIEYLAEIPGALLAAEPLGAAYRAQRESATRMRVVAQFQRVAVAYSAHNVLAFGVAHAMRLDRNVDPRPRRQNNFLQRERRSRRRVELRGMVRFVNREPVTLKFRQIRRQSKQLLPANQEIRAVQQPAAALCGQSPHLGKL